jgi:hypothetical protein
MRSENVFLAASRIPNRYTLCHALAQATRQLHVASTRTQDTTNKVLVDIGSGSYGMVVKSQVLPPPPTELDVLSI